MLSRAIKLKTHNRNVCSEDMIICLEAFSKEEKFVDGDVVEIKATDHDEQAMKLFLKVKELPLELQQKGAPLSIAADVAQTFGFLSMRSVTVEKVDKEDIKVDLLEVKFKDYCLSRSDMWRFTNTLIDTCVYVSKKLLFCDSVRTQVLSLWSKGTSVSAGLVLAGTKILFRSSSAHMFICLQISEEMWQFDTSGDLYFDKAVLRFLKELFDHWKDVGCNHHVTLVFFSRTFFPGRSENDLSNLKLVLSRDYRGIYYTDYYEVILDGTKWMEWAYVVNEIKRNFKDYKKKTNCDEDSSEPAGCISRATQGNFLECLNLTVNLFSRKHVNPHFHLTGQQVVIVTAGVGVFEVQRELTRITNERMMDFGIGVDIVSLTEQPLHAVPLFSFQTHNHQDDYTVPHWINYSFYDPKTEWTGGWFQPRIRVPDFMINNYLKKDFSPTNEKKPIMIPAASRESRSNTPNLFLKRGEDFDEYDSQVFKKANTKGTVKSRSTVHTDSPVLRRHRSNEYLYGSSFMPSPQHERARIQPDQEDQDGWVSRKAPHRARRHLCSESGESPNLSGPIVSDSVDPVPHSPSVNTYLPRRHGSDALKNRPFINPFRPESLPHEVSTNKRRWMHAFPLTSTGHAFQSHHVVGEDSKGALFFSGQNKVDNEGGKEYVRKRSESDSDLIQLGRNDHFAQETHSLYEDDVMENEEDSNDSSRPTLGGERRKKGTRKRLNSAKRPLFESVGMDKRGVKPEILDNFAPIRRTGIDWKGLTDPACLPITTDYLPSEKMLADEFTTNLYSLLTTSTAQSHSESHSSHVYLSAVDGFRELISQRLSQGFQIVLSNSGTLSTIHKKLNKISSDSKAKRQPKEGTVLVKMSLGRVYHYLTLSYPTISVAVHRSKHTPNFGVIPYRYHLKPLGHASFVDCECKFFHDKMEEYNWNYLDQHVMGYEDFDILSEGIKYHRSRFLLLPASSGLKEQGEEIVISGFVRFFEFLNHLRRPSSRRSSHDNLSSLYSYTSRDSSVFTNRLSSKSRQASLVSLPEGVESHQQAYTRYSSWDVTPKFPLDQSRTLSPRSTSPLSARSSTGHAGNWDNTKILSTGKEARLQATLLRTVSADVGPSVEGVSVKRETTPTPMLGSHPSLSPDLSRPQSRNDRSSSEASFYLEGSGVVTTEDNSDGTTSSSTAEVDPTLVKSDVTITETPATPRRSTSPSIPEDEPRRIPQTNNFSDIITAMKDTKCGVDFVVPSKGSHLLPDCFIAMELVEWLKENVEGVLTTKQGLRLGQDMQTKGLIVHSSGNIRIPFQYGFYLFSLTNTAPSEVSDLPSPNLDKSYIIVADDLEDFKKRWFEAGVLVDRSEDDDGSVRSTNSSESPAGTFNLPMHTEEDLLGLCKGSDCDPEWTISRTAEIFPDVNDTSDRLEWCTVNYDSVFVPNIAYQMEFQWVVATATVLSKMISQWCRKAEMSGFRLVSVPSWQTLEENPFCKPHKIPFPLDFEKMKSMGIDTNTKTVFKLVHQVLQKCGFVLDPVSIQDDMDCLYHDAMKVDSKKSLESWIASNDIGWHSDPVYVHYTGLCLVKPRHNKLRCSSLRQSSRRSSSGYFFRTDSEATLNALSPDMDSVFHSRQENQWSLRSNHTPVHHSTPHCSPSHSVNFSFHFDCYPNTNTPQNSLQRSMSIKPDVSVIFKEIEEYCSNINDHLDEVFTNRLFFNQTNYPREIASTY